MPAAHDRQAMEARFKADLVTGVTRGKKHESGDKHVTGAATYVADRLSFANQLYLHAHLSDYAHARIKAIDTTTARSMPGVAAVITAEDVPGALDIGPVYGGDPLLARDVVEYVGQPVVAVAADTADQARAAAHAVRIDYEELRPILDIREALEREHFVLDPHRQERGDADGALQRARNRIDGELEIGGQEHFYLEGQAVAVMPTEDDGMLVYSSTQNPTEIQKLVASVLGIDMNAVTVDTRRMGGGFGGKETQAAGPACLAAVVANRTQRPTRMRLSRRDDTLMTGKRHPFLARYQVGYDDTGRLSGVIIDLAANCGYSPDLSGAIVDRAMFHVDNAYYLGDARVTGYRCKTHLASNTAFRGFGGPQGMLVIEEIMDRIARGLGLDPLEVRRRNYYDGAARNTTHYYQTLEQDGLLDEMTTQLVESADYHARREAIDTFNDAHRVLKRGMALTPVKFGISFTTTFLNQAGALIHVYTDGSIHLNHGGTEMGQGLNTKVQQIVAEVFQIETDRIRITATRTDKVPNTSPTAASSGADLNGMAARNAADTIRQRLVDFAAAHFRITPEEVAFWNGMVYLRNETMTFEALIGLAYQSRISLSSTGYYRTPKIHYDRDRAAGKPFYYFAYGVACSEVIIDTQTGEYRLLRTDILHDVGQSLNPAIDIGQIEGGYAQGVGWLTTEELVWDESGRLMTPGPATYKIPAASDMPSAFHVDLVESRPNPEDTVFRSKAVGEPPLMLGISAWCAIKDAIASVDGHRTHPVMDAPATPERVFWATRSVSDASTSRPARHAGSERHRSDRAVTE
ncbi:MULTISPECIES: xanthine dehydrogenase molybdopterin binding subunit [Spiribacter]|nr:MULTISPECIES: xanthine dehydrogenase molybdopterin binding subunit [Spiribacter]